MDVRPILRASYDGDYEKAIRLLVDIIETQQKTIKSLQKDIDDLRDDLKQTYE